MSMCVFVQTDLSLLMTLVMEREIQYGISIDHFGKYLNKDGF